MRALENYRIGRPHDVFAEVNGSSGCGCGSELSQLVKQSKVLPEVPLNESLPLSLEFRMYSSREFDQVAPDCTNTRKHNRSSFPLLLHQDLMKSSLTTTARQRLIISMSSGEIFQGSF